MSPQRTVTQQESKFVRTLSVFVILAFILELVGLVGPGWIVITSDVGIGVSIRDGIWFAIVCFGDTCEVKSNYVTTLDDSK